MCPVMKTSFLSDTTIATPLSWDPAITCRCGFASMSAARASVWRDCGMENLSSNPLRMGSLGARTLCSNTPDTFASMGLFGTP